MAHPFSILFEKALMQSRGDNNQVIAEAEKLRDRGYDPKEIYSVLKQLHTSLIYDADINVLAEALEEFSIYIDEAT